MSKIILARTNRGATDPIGIKNSSGVLINPATEETLLLVKAALEDLEINCETINLNTDEIEAKLDELIALASAGDSELKIGNTGLIAKETETVVISYTVPTGKQYKLYSLYLTGSGNGLFKIYKNSVLQFEMRNSASIPNLDKKFNSYLTFVAGDVIQIKVTHYENKNLYFSGYLEGKEFSI